MEFDLNMHEQLIMYQLIADAEDDIVIKTDLAGFIYYDSSAAILLAKPMSENQTGQHILSLVDEPYKAMIRNEFNLALRGRISRDWIEFQPPPSGDDAQWYAIRLAALRDERGEITGTLAIIRDQKEKKHLQDRLTRAELTDPLTGLTNRQAWMEMLKHLIDTQRAASMVLIDIDHFKAINLHYGVSSGDKVLIAFAEFLRSQTPKEISISRVGGSRFGLFFPDWPIDRTEKVCREIVGVLANLRCTDWQHRFSVTASVGVASVSPDIDATVKTVETALRLARAKGGNTVTTDQNSGLRRDAHKPINH